MTEDYFWGATLSSSNKEIKWEPDALKENGGLGDISLSARGEHALVLKQALLGPDTDENESCVVEVETSGYKVASIQQPIIVLSQGKKEHVLLDLNFPDPPVTLRLIKGKGPVHISGSHIISSEQYNDDDDEDEDDDLDDFDEQQVEEEDDEEEADVEEKKKEEKGTAKKRSNSNSAQSQAKKKKKGKDD